MRGDGAPARPRRARRPQPDCSRSTPATAGACASASSRPSSARGAPAGRRAACSPRSRSRSPATSTRRRSCSPRGAPAEPWFCSEQPERDRIAIAALGCVVELEARGPDRFEAVAARWRALASAALCDGADARGAGLIASGGFAFAPDGGASPHWAGFAPASMHVPEVALARAGDDVHLTVAALAQADDTADGLLAGNRAPPRRAAQPAAAAARSRPGRPLSGRGEHAARALRGRRRPRRRAHPRR